MRALLWNIAQSLKRYAQAEAYYREALQHAADDADVHWSVSLNRLRLVPEAEKASRMAALSVELDQAGDQYELARHHLNLGHQATDIGKQTLRLAYHHLDTARRLAEPRGDTRLTAEAIDALAQLYENRGRIADGLALSAQALRIVGALSPARKADLVISLEWRRGRLLKARGESAAALAAYRRVVEQIDAVRQDIPVEYEDGRSSYRTLFEPVYTTYADLLLRQVDDHGGGNNSLAKSNIGEPTTYILADELSVPALLKGLREGRTFVKLRSAKDPAVELEASVAPTKDTIETTAPVVLKFAVKGLAEPMKLRLVKNGATLREQDLTADQVVEESVNAPELEEDSYRAELRAGTELRVVTSHLFVKKPGAVTPPTTTPPVVTESGGCSLSPSSKSLSVAGFGSIMIALAAMASRLRRRG